jgi:hypothetical protein
MVNGPDSFVIHSDKHWQSEPGNGLKLTLVEFGMMPTKGTPPPLKKKGVLIRL